MTVKMRYYYPPFLHREPIVVDVEVFTALDVLNFLKNSPKHSWQFQLVCDGECFPFSKDDLDDDHYYQLDGDYIIQYCGKSEVV